MNNQDNKFNNRVYGCAIIKSINANYNADFTKQPRTLPDGTVYATDKALKYTIRHYLYKNYPKDNIMYFTRYKGDNSLQPLSLQETYTKLFGEMPKALKAKGKQKWNLFYYDRGKVIAKGQQVAKAKLDKFLKSLEEKPEYSEIMIEISAKAKVKKADEIKKLNEKISKEEKKDNKFYFYVVNNDEIKEIEIDNAYSFEETLKLIDLEFFGGHDKLKILYDLLSCIDVRLFGATFAGDTNVSIHGPAQINHAVDRFINENNITENLSYSEQIKSPFRNEKAKGGEAEMTTIGTQSKSMEAHYVHHFSVNPKNIDDALLNLKHYNPYPEIDPYNEEDWTEEIQLSHNNIDKLKEALQKGATFYDSSSKAGVENELLLWVQLREGSKLVLPNFTELITVKRNNDKIEIDLTGVKNILENIPEMKVKENENYVDKNQIEKIDLYYNPNIELIGIPEIEEGGNSIINKYNIFTGAQISNEDNSN